MSTLLKWVSVLEVLMGAPTSDAATLSKQATMHAKAIAELQSTISDLQNNLMKQCNELLNQVISLVDFLEEPMLTIKYDVGLLKKVASGAFSGYSCASTLKHKIPKPKSFGRC